MYVESGHESGNSVLLQTAVARIFNSQRRACASELFIVLDPESQCSYITQRAREMLALHALRKKPISIAAFGVKNIVTRVCDIVTVGVNIFGGENVELSLLVVPFICEPLSHPLVCCCLNKYPHLSNLDLVTPLSDNYLRDPDILIGSDYYWDLVTGETIRGQKAQQLYRHDWDGSCLVQCCPKGQSSTNLITHVLRVDTSNI